MYPDILRACMSFLLVFVVGVCLTHFLNGSMFRKVKFALREPPQVSPSVPYIGHLVGIFCHKNYYYTKLR